MSLESRFQISVPDDALALLQRKLADVRFPDELGDAGWDYGVPLSDVKRLVNIWKDRYDWRAHERELNQLPMFTRDIEVEGFGILNVHYIHQRSELESAIPVLFVHGCTWNDHLVSPSLLTLCVGLTRAVLSIGPGSFIEVTKMLPLLTATEAGHPSFHVVAPSLPGYAWSQAPSKRGFRSMHYAEVRTVPDKPGTFPYL
jgi:Epoxide hydrolase N terminus